MANDIISEGKTQATISNLMSGVADEKTMQSAIGSLLVAMEKMADKVDRIEEKLWKKDDLERMIDERHREHCSECPAKKYVDSMMLQRVGAAQAKDGRSPKPWYMEILTSTTIRDSIVIIILLWFFVTMKTTVEQQERITDAVRTTISGGIAK